MSKRNKHGKVIYWACLLIYAGVLAALAVLALKAVWSFAEQYQASMPEPVVDKYIAGLNQNLFDEGVAETISSMPHEVQTDEEVQEAVREILNDEITYARTSSDEPGMNAYAILCGDSSFGKVFLKRDETKDPNFKLYGKDVSLPYDLRPWLIAKEEFDFTGLYTSVQVTIPESYSVSLNGHTLGPEYIIEDGIQFDCLKSYYSINPNLPKKVTYRFDNIIGHIDPMIYDESGSEYTVDPDRDDSQYIKPCDEATLSRLDAFCQKFIEPYSKYISGILGKYSSGGYAELQNYVVAGSDLDKRLFEALDGLGWAHTNSYSVDSYVLNSAIDIGEGYYVCDVTTETTSITSGVGEQHDVNNLKILVLDNGTELRAVSLV